VLIEETRAKIEKNHRRGLFDRVHRGLLFAVFPYPERLATVARLLRIYAASGLRGLVRRTGAARLLGTRLAQLEALAPAGREDATGELPAFVPASSPRRLRVALVAGCVQRVFFPEVNAATLSVLSAEGCDVTVPQGQGCCGALSMHAGREEEGLDFARRLVEAFCDLDVDAVVVNAAGCGSNLKDYGRLLAKDPRFAEVAARFSSRVRDVSELLAGLPPVARRGPISTNGQPVRVAYHDACHLANAQGIRSAPRDLLRAIPDVELVEIPDGDRESCCGSAGIYNLVEPESADEIGARKADQVASARADLLASANPGCTLQIQKLLRERGVALPAMHPIEIVRASILAATRVAS
jgi:glycolate oxidase iron-sulfur subunit